jgi:hypothetical protein
MDWLYRLKAVSTAGHAEGASERCGSPPITANNRDNHQRGAAGNYGPESAKTRMLRLNGLAKMARRRVQIATREKLQKEGHRKNPPTAFPMKRTKAILTPRRSRRAR